MSRKNHLEMNHDLFANMPSEIIIEILSKLPVRTIIHCKCVCKSWLNLLESREFAKSHLPKSIPGLAVYESDSYLYKLFDFDDGLNLEHHGLHYKPLTEFNIPACNGRSSGSTSGLLFLFGMSNHNTLHICNPITRDYIQLDFNEFVDSPDDSVAYGFGSSKITGQHKVVRIFQECGNSSPNPECVCHVYTIGTGLWRRIPVAVPLVYDCYSDGAFLNGNLHWLVTDFEGSRRWISCFDLETERFSTFSAPILYWSSSDPTILDGCLCLCDNSADDGISIWLMKEYGVEKSWSKLFSISDAMPLEAQNLYNLFHAIKIFKDGDILLQEDDKFHFYSKKNNTVQKLETFEPNDCISALIYTPSFLSLKSFGTEKVISF